MGSRTLSRYPHIDDFATHPTLNLISRASPEVLNSLLPNASDSLRDNIEISDLHLHTQASDDSKSQNSRLDEIMLKWVGKAIENCHRLDRLSYDPNSITNFNISYSNLYTLQRLQSIGDLQVFQSSKWYPISSRNWYWFVRGNPQAWGSLLRTLNWQLAHGWEPGIESMAEKNTNTKYL